MARPVDDVPPPLTTDAQLYAEFACCFHVACSCSTHVYMTDFCAISDLKLISA